MGIEMGSKNGSVIEAAKEELEILEAQYPNGFYSLKMDLIAFIQTESHCNITSSLFSTQESTSCCRKKRMKKKRKRLDSNCMVFEKGEDQIDAVMERARECLQKIQHLKATL